MQCEAIKTAVRHANELEACVKNASEDEVSGLRGRTLSPGELVAGKYLIRGVLGRGGFGVVYDAEHLGLRRNVALKVLHCGLHTPLALVERFWREARISALVRHPNVLDVFDTGTLDDGSPYLVMERIYGQTLQDRLTRGPLSVADVVEIGRQVLTALCVLGEVGIVHRDIKPENLMLHESTPGSFVVKLVDFGVSKRAQLGTQPRLTNSGALVGTPRYMSPEQLRGEDVDARADLYAVGVVLYEALTGQLPHDASNLSELVLTVLHNPVRPIRGLRADCPAELERLVLKALSKDRAARFDTPLSMRAALDAFATRYQEILISDRERASEVTPARRGLSERATRAAGHWNRTPRAMRFGTLIVLLSVPWGALYLREARPLPLKDEVKDEVASRSHAASVATSQGEPVELVIRGTAATVLTSPVPTLEQAAETAPESLMVAPPSSNSGSSARRVGALQQAISAYEAGDFARAHRLYRRAVELNPRQPTAWRGLGLVAARREEYAEARDALEYYLTLVPSASDQSAIRARINALPW